MSTTATSTKTDQYVHYHDGGIPGRRRVRTGSAAEPAFSELPKIDFQRIYSESIDDRKELAQEVGAACRDVGFFYAVNHGVSREVLDGTFEAVKRYFDLPTEVKMECHNQKTKKFRGYEAFLEGRLDPSTRGELAHYYTDAQAPEPMANPSFSDLFRPALYRYYNAMFNFSKRMLRIFALALDLPEDYFDGISTHPMTNIRAVHYPPQQCGDDVGIGAHTDFCWFTLVCQSQTTLPALEVLNGNGIWVPVKPQQNTFIVNIADFLKLVTGGTWQSTVHRVRNLGGEERYSMPFFFSPNETARVSILDQFREPGKDYEEIVVGKYFQRRLDVDRTTHFNE